MTTTTLNQPSLEAVAEDAWREIIERIHEQGHTPPASLHEVVCQALSRAYQCGQQEARAEAEQISDSMQQIFDERQGHTARTAVAAVMECLERTDLEMPVARIGSIWSRVSLDMVLDPEGQLCFRLNQRAAG